MSKLTDRLASRELENAGLRAALLDQIKLLRQLKKSMAAWLPAVEALRIAANESAQLRAASKYADEMRKNFLHRLERELALTPADQPLTPANRDAFCIGRIPEELIILTRDRMHHLRSLMLQNLARERGRLAEKPLTQELPAAVEALRETHRNAADETILQRENAELRKQRDALLTITWLDLPAEPCESIEEWKRLFSEGWIRRNESDEYLRLANAENAELRKALDEADERAAEAHADLQREASDVIHGLEDRGRAWKALAEMRGKLLELNQINEPDLRDPLDEQRSPALPPSNQRAFWIVNEIEFAGRRELCIVRSDNKRGLEIFGDYGEDKIIVAERDMITTHDLAFANMLCAVLNRR